MRFFFYCMFLLLTGCSDYQKKSSSVDLIKIDSTWKQEVISKDLIISIPDSVFFEKVNDVKSTYGVSKSGLYGVDFYDSVSFYIENQNNFRDALKVFLTYQFKDSQVFHYDLTAIDTAIGNSTGYFISGYTNDSTEQFKKIFFYLTLANNKYYWFYACQLTPMITNEIWQFFHSIQFIPDNFKEAEFELPPTKIHKEANYSGDG
jgi:hypothetical protein